MVVIHPLLETCVTDDYYFQVSGLAFPSDLDLDDASLRVEYNTCPSVLGS